MKNQNCDIIAVVNQKGGVGKTTTALNLATALAAVGKKTLLIDLDPQGNLSTGAGITSDQRVPDIYDVIIGDATIDEAAKNTNIPGLFVAPSTVNLAAADIELAGMSDREFVLKTRLDESDEFYHYVIIDCPPSLGLLTVNALTVATEVLVPLQCEFYALEGLANLLGTIKLVQDNLNEELILGGIVLTMYDRRNRLTRDVEDDVRNHLGELVFKTVIPRNVRVSEAPSHGKPAIIYDHRCTGSQAYLYLAREILKRQTKHLKEAV